MGTNIFRAVNSTLIYLERGDEYLMLHRTKKENDLNHDKWIGVGGKFEDGESPEDCALRETREETGLTLTRWRYRGLVTFVSDRYETEYMHLFTADGWTGTPKECDEGELAWIKKSELLKLRLWEGDKIFLRLLDTDEPFFSLKLKYEGDTLVLAQLNGAAAGGRTMKPKLLVSACLLGTPCRYDGKSKKNEAVCALAERFELIPVCPEVLGGLPTPRTPSERRGACVVRKDGRDVTAEYRRGAECALETARREGVLAAVLKERSPSCGSGEIYDGTFTGALTAGDGVTAELLKANGMTVYGEGEQSLTEFLCSVSHST